MNWYVGSEGRQRSPKRGITGSHGMVGPAGMVHAVDASTHRVACGTPLRELATFDKLDWDESSSPLKCRKCREIVARQAAQPVPQP